MPRHDFTQDELRDYLLMRLNRHQHWCLLCLGQGGRFIATEVRRRHYMRARDREWEEVAIPGPWLGGAGFLPIALAHRKHMDAADLAAIIGEFSKVAAKAEDLEGRRILVCGDTPPAHKQQALQALNGWLTARPDYQNVGVE